MIDYERYVYEMKGVSVNKGHLLCAFWILQHEYVQQLKE